ncbi:MAG TPA: hypothetical protein VMU22_14770 [Rhizomicrobium sp.]|nr:hypothetical protein [Rhizomicrobium sp.]
MDDSPTQYRARSAQLRETLRTARSPVNRMLLMNLIEQYERMAGRSEERPAHANGQTDLVELGPS